MKYHVVEETSKYSFEDECERRLRDGWKLVGAMSAETPFNPIWDTTTYRQAFIYDPKKEIHP